MDKNLPSDINDPRSCSIVFMGTPEFAVASLEALLNEGFNIVGVVTAPDKQAGRGMKLQESAVKKYAAEKGLNIFQPEKLKNIDFISLLKSLQADVQVVVAFRMLPEVVWNMPTLGTVNLHASLLPQYRGAAPINWAIINGEKETGVTTFKLQQEIDTGNILLQEKIPIGDDETAGELHGRMKDIGAALIVKTINGLLDGSIKEVEQSAISSQQSTISNQKLATLKQAPKIFTETCRIDWNKTANEIHDLIRGLSPYPAAFSFLNGKMMKVYKSKTEIAQHDFETGTLHTDEKHYLKFTCADGFVHLLEVQPEGKRRMAITDFLRGYRVSK